jgi:hypothetical protein
MKLNLRLVALSTVILSALGGGAMLSACGGGGDNKDGGVDSGGGETSTKKDAGGGQDTGASDAPDDAPTPTIDPLCTAPNTPSNGACVADAGFGCNPITAAPCKVDAGESCDFGQPDFQCYPAPPPNTQALCAACDDQNTACLPGSTCVPVDQNGNSKCAKFCCDDNDCTGGHCDNTTLSQGQATPFGFCVK